MNFEVMCGTEEQCYKCPFSRLTTQKAQELGRLAACFERASTLPSDMTINRVAGLSEIEINIYEIIKVRNAIVQMTINNCEVKENDNGKDF